MEHLPSIRACPDGGNNWQLQTLIRNGLLSTRLVRVEAALVAPGAEMRIQLSVFERERRFRPVKPDGEPEGIRENGFLICGSSGQLWPPSGQARMEGKYCIREKHRMLPRTRLEVC